MTYAIEINEVTKIFEKEITAVDSVSFSVEEREIFGLLGPNGAGKTTMIKMITTLTKPTEGSISVFGVNVLKEPSKVRQMLGYVPQAVSVDTDLTAYENLLIFSKLFHVERSVRKKRIVEALEYMDLAERANDLVRHFSGGMMRRLEIAQALVNRPRILMFDEPSIGLDPTSKRRGWEYIKRLNQEFGITVFITTHDMLEADELCDRLAIMNRGKIATLGSPSELKASVHGDAISIKLSSPATNILLPREIGFVESSNQDSIKIRTEHAEIALPKIMQFLSKSGYGIESISTNKPNLDEVFTKYTSATLDEGREVERRGETRMARSSFARHSR